MNYLSEIKQPSIFLIVEFNWPIKENFIPEYGENAAILHKIVLKQDWIEETVAASGGIGSGPSSVWIFKLKNYASLDRLLHNPEDEVCKAYIAFFSNMPEVYEKIKEEVLFR